MQHKKRQSPVDSPSSLEEPKVTAVMDKSTDSKVGIYHDVTFLDSEYLTATGFTLQTMNRYQLTTLSPSLSLSPFSLSLPPSPSLSLPLLSLSLSLSLSVSKLLAKDKYKLFTLDALW